MRPEELIRKLLSTTAKSAIESDLDGSEDQVTPGVAREYMLPIRQVVAFGAGLFALAQWIGAPQLRVMANGQGATVAANPAPSADEIRSLIARAVENQHRNDRALEEFDRIEHVTTRKNENGEILTDRSDRVLPSGTGTMKLKMAENGISVSSEEYRRELQFAVTALDLAIHPNERYKQDLVKFERRKRERTEFVDMAAKAFRITWAGRETRANSTGDRGPRTVAKLILDPDPSYKPATRFAVILQHVHATLWVDEAQEQFMRIEGDISSDVSFIGGIAGKIYQGGHFTMEQEEVVSGVWLPTLYTYDVDGRKFVFAFGVHERTEVTRYRRVGPPSQAIEVIRNELNNPVPSPAVR